MIIFLTPPVQPILANFQHESQSLLAYLYASGIWPRWWSAFAGPRIRPVALVPVPLPTAIPP